MFSRKPAWVQEKNPQYDINYDGVCIWWSFWVPDAEGSTMWHFLKLRRTLSLPRPPCLLILPVTTLTLAEGTTLLVPGKPDTGPSIGAQRVVLWPTNLTVFSLSLIPMANSHKPPKHRLIPYISHHLHCCLGESNQRHLTCIISVPPGGFPSGPQGSRWDLFKMPFWSDHFFLSNSNSQWLPTAFLYLLKLFYFEIFIDLRAIARNSREDLGIFGNPVFPNRNSLNHSLFPVAFKIKIEIAVLVWHWTQRNLGSNPGFTTDQVTLASYFASLILWFFEYKMCNKGTHLKELLEA